MGMYPATAAAFAEEPENPEGVSAPGTPRERQQPPKAIYTYRRHLMPAELLPAVGAAVGVGAVVFYVTWLFLQRTPLDISGSARDHLSRGPSGRGRPSRGPTGG
jgi:hypothetical protein